MRKLFLVLLTFTLFFLLFSCDSNFYNVVPVKHEYDNLEDLLNALSNIELKNDGLSEPYYYIIELDSQIEYTYYIESVTTTGNAELSTPEYPKMSSRGFDVGMTIYIDGIPNIVKLKAFSEEGVQYIVIEDYDLSFFISYSTTDILDVMIQNIVSIELAEISWTINST